MFALLSRWMGYGVPSFFLRVHRDRIELVLRPWSGPLPLPVLHEGLDALDTRLYPRFRCETEIREACISPRVVAVVETEPELFIRPGRTFDDDTLRRMCRNFLTDAHDVVTRTGQGTTETAVYWRNLEIVYA